jgi:hypothetical protein
MDGKPIKPSATLVKLVSIFFHHGASYWTEASYKQPVLNKRKFVFFVFHVF